LLSTYTYGLPLTYRRYAALEGNRVRYPVFQ